MAYNPNAPADDEFLADFPAEQREQHRALIEDRIVDADSVRGLVPGNTSGNVAVNNGTVCANLNADKLDGHDATYFSADGHVHAAATTSSDGFMSNTDKSKLDGVTAGAEPNQNAFANVKVGSTTIQADAKQDTLELAAGTNITLTPDQTNDKVTIAAPDVLPLSGGTMTGAITVSYVDFIKRSVNDNHLTIMGGTAYGSSASIYLMGGDASSNAGMFQLRAQAGSGGKDLVGKPDGTLTWDGTEISLSGHTHSYLPLSGGTMTGAITRNGDVVKNSADTSWTRYCGGTSNANGAHLLVYGKSSSTNAGYFYLTSTNGTNSASLVGKPDGSLIWNGNSVVRASAQRTYTYTNISVSAHGRTKLGNLTNVPIFYSAVISGTNWAYCNVIVGTDKSAYINNVGASAASGINVTLNVLEGVTAL